jgi:branched-chain amino acid transport system substrate-binding protein
MYIAPRKIQMMKLLLASLMLMLSLSACEKSSLAQQRADRQAENKGDIVIAVAWPMQMSKVTLVNGINLAADEINAQGGILNGRKIKIVVKDDAASLTTGRLVAQEIADDVDVAAVIGHLNSYIAEPASQIYERAGLVMITPGASGQKITEQGGHLTFRSLPGNRDQGRQIADYALAQGYKNVAIYYIKNEYGIDLANFFEQRARQIGINIADRRSYDPEARGYEAIMTDWQHFLKMDAIFLVGSLPDSAEIIRDARAVGLNVPVFGGAGLDSPELIKEGGKSVEGTVVFSLFNIEDPRPEVQAFARRFEKKFGTPPDSNAAQGYDTLNLLVHAMKKADSTVPAMVATALKATKGWVGVTGNRSFDANGELLDMHLSKVMVDGGKFVSFDNVLPRQAAVAPANLAQHLN